MVKLSFLDKLTGSLAPEDDYDDLFENDQESLHNHQQPDDTANMQIHHYSDNTEQDTNTATDIHTQEKAWIEEDEPTGELAVDIFQTDDEIVLKALVAGVPPRNLEIELTRDMITIKGTREEHKETTAENYYYQELYWGTFERTILIPEEIDVDASSASERHGILVIRMPKVNKARKARLKVKSR